MQEATSAHVCTQHKTPAEYIAQLPRWDGRPRLNTWLRRVTSAPNTPVSADTAKAGRQLILSMTARAIQPGCQVEQTVLLIGPPASGKTRILQALGGDWYSNSNLLDDPTPGALLKGNWVQELEASYLHTDSLHRFKSFLTTTVDTYRLPYHKQTNSDPRLATLVLTAQRIPNWWHAMDEQRHMLAHTITRRSPDMTQLLAIRDQLFAEAKHELQGAA